MLQIMKRYTNGLVRVVDSDTGVKRVISETRYNWELANGPVPEGYIVQGMSLVSKDGTIELKCVQCGIVFKRAARIVRYANSKVMKGPYCGIDCKCKAQLSSRNRTKTQHVP